MFALGLTLFPLQFVLLICIMTKSGLSYLRKEKVKTKDGTNAFVGKT